MKRLARIVLWSVVTGATTVLAVVAFANGLVAAASRGRCYQSLDLIPARKIGLVLGTSKYVAAGRENLHFRYRMDAAERLFKAGKVSYLIVSGDNSTRRYNEPVTMKADLVRRGIPPDRIYLDYAGFRTLDSIIRAGTVFGASEFTVISQRWHNKRAIYIGASRGLDVIGFDARNVSTVDGMRSVLRERFARVLAVLDIMILNRQPRFLGPAVQVGSRNPPPVSTASESCPST